MSHKQAQHARQVIAAFKDKLPDDLENNIGDKHFAELELLVESAIVTAVLEELDIAANQIEALSQNIRNFAEYYDD